jgi:hypothetical protein
MLGILGFSEQPSSLDFSNKEDYMSTGDRVTGVRDEHYNLVSILYHTLQGAETYDTYISDAEGAGDQELANSSAKYKKKSVDGLLGLRSCWGGSSPSDDPPVVYPSMISPKANSNCYGKIGNYS